jgi:hypothetical protein
MDESDVVITSLGPIPPMNTATEVVKAPKRRICEHVVVMRLKEDVDPQQEAEMLDVLWSLQFHFDSIAFLSTGRLIKGKEGWTHALHIRFENKESLVAYLNHPILKETEKRCQHWLQDVFSFGFDAEVDAKADSVHQKQQNFENTLEHILCLQVEADTNSEQLREMEKALDGMPAEQGSSILLDFTRGATFNTSNCHYTHALVARLTSDDALEKYLENPYHKKISVAKVRSICSEAVYFDYLVDAGARKRVGIYGVQ